MSQLGNGVQVVKVSEDYMYQLDEKLLGEVLMKEEIKDLPVVVVNVAGSCHSGKAFLLNLFLQYLTSPTSAQKDGSWLDEGGESLISFNWHGNSETNAPAIFLWSEPIITTLSNGEKVALVLSKTQGTLDANDGFHNNLKILALSTLTSSVQIYNLSGNLREDDVHNLELFTTYGKIAEDREKSFQTLQFLIRDWPHFDEYPFGAEGGNKLLEKRFEISSNQPEELNELRGNIRSSFDKILCFLMPHPGLKVQSPTFKGNISDIDSSFRTHLKELVSSLFSSENLTPKTINGQRINSEELFNCFQSYVTLFNSDNILNPTKMQAIRNDFEENQRNIFQAKLMREIMKRIMEEKIAREQRKEDDPERLPSHIAAPCTVM